MDIPPRTRGIALIALSVCVVLIAIVIAWNAIERWLAIASINEYHLARLANRAAAARQAAAAAARHLPGDAATALPAIDPSTPDALQALERLQRAVPPGQRPVVGTAIAFAAALSGRTAQADAGVADAPFVNHLVALGQGRLPPFPDARSGEAPQQAVLSQAAQRHVATAWKAGDREALRSGLAALVLVEPRHPEYRFARALLAALVPPATPEAKSAAAGIIRELGAEAAKVVRRAVQLGVPDAAALIALIPQDQRTPEETQRLLAGGGGGELTLDALVQQALAAPAGPGIATAFRRCLDAERFEPARKLVDHAAEPLKRTLAVALAERIGDVQALAALQPERTDLRLTASTPIARSGQIAFHLSTRAGLVPRVGALRATVGGAPLPPESIRRWGSLVALKIPQTSGVDDVDIRFGDTVVFAGQVTL